MCSLYLHILIFLLPCASSSFAFAFLYISLSFFFLFFFEFLSTTWSCYDTLAPLMMVKNKKWSFLQRWLVIKKKMKKLALIFSYPIKQRLNAKLYRHCSNKNDDLTKTIQLFFMTNLKIHQHPSKIQFINLKWTPRFIFG